MKSLKNVVNGISFGEIFLSLFFSFSSYLILHKLFFMSIKYSSLNDFYTGISVYSNINKYSEIYFIFIYFLLFFVFLYVIRFIKNLNFENIKSYFISASIITITFSSLLYGLSAFWVCNCLVDKIPLLITIIFCISYLFHIDFKKLPVIILQCLSVFGICGIFSFKHYDVTPLGYLIFILLVGISLFDVIRRKNFSIFKNKISPFALIPFVVLLFGYRVNYFSNIDFHHLGEKVSTFWSVDHFGAKYYKDIMLVHGFADVIPFYLGKYLLGDSSLSGFYSGLALLNNFRITFTFLVLYFLFCGRINFILPALYFTGDVSFMLPTYLLIIKKYFLKRYYLFISLFIIFSLLFINFRTSIGSAWFVAALPALFAVIYSLVKDKSYSCFSKKLYFICIIFSFILVACVFRDEIIGYLSKAIYYLKGNLIVFGTMLNITKFYILPFKIFQYFILPFILFMFIRSIVNKECKIEILLIYTFALLFPTLLINYSLGRIDGENLTRAVDISYQYLLVLVPYYLYKFTLKYKRTMKIVSIIFIIISLGIFIRQISYSNRMFISNSNNKIYDTNYNFGFSKLSDNEIDFVKNVDSIVRKYSVSNDDFLDLTNHGALYFFLNKQLPIPYVSFYNAISPKLVKKYSEDFKAEKYHVIMIAPNIRHDDVFVSLRIPSLYKKILLSQHYYLVNENGYIFLIYTKDKMKFTKAELETLDKFLALRCLDYLPEAWYNNKLLNKLENLNIDYTLEQLSEGKGYKVKFNSKIKGSDIDYIKLQLNTKDKFIRLKLNNIQNEIIYSSDSGKALIPFANYPSWLLTEDVHEIIIKTTSDNLDISFLNEKDHK